MIRPIYPTMRKVLQWARKQSDYDGTMKPSEFRVWMNRKLGMNVPGTDYPEVCAQKWLARTTDQP